MAFTKIRGNTQILDLSVTNSQIAVKDAANPDGILLSKIQDGELLVKSDGSVPFTDTVTGVTPTQASHFATKGYVDAAAQGLDVKLSVRAVSQGNVSLSGVQTIDGVSLIAGDRVLLTGQTASVENGIYVVSASGWTRSPDATTNADVTPGMFTFVEEGTVGAGTGWVLTSTGPTTLDTTPLPFAQFSAAGQIIAGAGLTKTGNALVVVSANGGIVVTTDAIALTLDGSTLSVGASGVKLADAAEGSFLIAGADGGFAPHTISGDLTVNAAGVATLTPGSVNGDAIDDGSVALAKLGSGADGQVIVVGAGGVPAYVSVSGDATITSAGDLQLGAGVVGTTELADEAVTLTKLETLTPGNFIIGQQGGNAQVTLSGDVTVDHSGVVTINPATVVRVADIIKSETPVGLINGVNDTYVLANVPKAGTVDVFVNGMLQDAGVGNDYTISGDTITMLYLLNTPDKIRVSYFR